MNETNLYDIGAEFLLNYLYPDWTDKWVAECAGTFYRNYTPDILSVDEERRTVSLARDGFARLLPQGLIARDNALKGGDFKQKNERLEKKAAQVRDLFKPVDTLSFRSRLHVEKQLEQLSSDKLPFLLKRYLGYDMEQESDPLVRKVAPLLLFVSRLRADFGFIRDLLARLIGCKVEMRTGSYSWEEGADYSCPSIAYYLIVPDLTEEAYRSLMSAIAPLREFLLEWFIPFDTHCTIEVKYHEQPFLLGDRLTLDYNTEIHQ